MRVGGDSGSDLMVNGSWLARVRGMQGKHSLSISETDIKKLNQICWYLNNKKHTMAETFFYAAIF